MSAYRSQGGESGGASAAADVERALELLHDTRLARDAVGERRAQAMLESARERLRRENADLAAELDIEARAEEFRRQAYAPLITRAMRGERLWDELLAEAQQLAKAGDAHDLGLPDEEVAEDVIDHPLRLRTALYAKAMHLDYFTVRAATENETLVAARAHSQGEAKRLQDFLSEEGYLPRRDRTRRRQ